MLRYLIRKQWGDQQEGQSMSTADKQRSEDTVAAETLHQQPIQDIRIQVGDDNSLDNSEVFEVDDDKRPLPDTPQQFDDEERRPNATPKETRTGNKRSDVVKRRYEKTKRCRKFSQSWKKSFPWITLTNGKMFCSTCLDNRSLCDKQSKFVKDGCENFHIKALKMCSTSKGSYSKTGD